MPVLSGLGQPPVQDSWDLGPPVVERMGLEAKPGPAIVSSYVLTRAAQLAFRAINVRNTEPAGQLFWISGPAGAGKTHFLNYLLALESKAGSAEFERARRMTFTLEVAGRVRNAEIEAYLLEALAVQLSGGDQRTALIWREMRGAAALRVALEQARRMGVGAITGGVDLGIAESQEATDYFATLAEVAANTKHLRFTVVIAARSPAPACATPLEVAPAGPGEALVVAVNRARSLHQQAREAAAGFYESGAAGGFEPAAIFPFHPETLRTLKGLAGPPGTVAAISVLAREALISASDPSAETAGRLIYPADLMSSPGVMRRLRAHLGETGMTALEAARQALGGWAGNELELAGEMVNTLVLDYAAGGHAPLALEELEARAPILAGGGMGETWATPFVSELLRKVSLRSNGVIRFEPGGAWFDPGAAGAPEIAAFNAALGLLRKFDPELAVAHGVAELEDRLSSLGEALADALEAAGRTREVLSAALAEEGMKLSAPQEAALAEYAALAEAGPGALLKAAADPARRETAGRAAATYAMLAQAAALMPRMRAMREYLHATGLRIAYEEDPGRDPRVTALETECQLLAAELTPRTLAGPPRNLDALEARFQKFKWTYVQHYRLAHAQWRAEMERLGALADDLRSHLDALRRLNSISALGPPAGEELAPSAAELGRRIARCELEGVLKPEATPRCPSCNYLLGTAAPRPELADLAERARRALAVKFAVLSQSAIARIVREHDRSHRLDGFLKITQAAQTDALVRVLDEKLARYLARLLDENLGSAGARARGVVQPLNEARFGPRRGRLQNAAPGAPSVKITPPAKGET